MTTAELVAVGLVSMVAVYAGVGLLFALPFVLRGVERIDPAARGASWGFRLIVVPGVIAFWPLLLRRWLRGAARPVERNAHRRQSTEDAG